MLRMTEYLGDSVYVRWEGNQLCLYTYNGIDEKNHIYFEEEVLAALLKFLGVVQVARASSPREGQ